MMTGLNGDMRTLLARIQETEASAHSLDPGTEQRDEVCGAVEAHVREHLSSLGQRAAYLPDRRTDPTVFAIAETAADIADASPAA